MGSEEQRKDEYIGFELSSALKQAAAAAAEREGRSVSNFMRQLIRRHVEIERRVYGDDSTRSEAATVS